MIAGSGRANQRIAQEGHQRAGSLSTSVLKCAKQIPGIPEFGAGQILRPFFQSTRSIFCWHQDRLLPWEIVEWSHGMILPHFFQDVRALFRAVAESEAVGLEPEALQSAMWPADVKA